MACEPEVMGQGDRFLDALGSTSHASLREGRLVLRFGEPGQEHEMVLAGSQSSGPAVDPERAAAPESVWPQPEVADRACSHQ